MSQSAWAEAQFDIGAEITHLVDTELRDRGMTEVSESPDVLVMYAVGVDMKALDLVTDTDDGIPWVIETAFGWCPDGKARRLITGVNWSPGIINPFRELGHFGQSLDTILGNQRANRDEPVILVLHMACPRVEYTDRGKSAVVVRS